MVRIGSVPGIVAVKERLAALQERGLVKAWALPYENILTRADAAIFYLAPAEEHALEAIWQTLADIPNFRYQENQDKKVSDLPWRVQFNAPASPPA